MTAPLKEFSSSSLNKHWLQRVNPNPFGAHLELSRYLSHSGSDCSHPRAQLGELLDCTDGIPVLQPGFTQGWLKCSFWFCWHHLCGNFPASFILFIDSVTLTVIILEAPQGIAGVWRVTKSTSLGLSSKIRGRVIVWLSEIFIQWNQGLCILVVSASELPVKNRNSFFVSPINCLGVLLSRLWEG